MTPDEQVALEISVGEVRLGVPLEQTALSVCEGEREIVSAIPQYEIHVRECTAPSAPSTGTGTGRQEVFDGLPAEVPQYPAIASQTITIAGEEVCELFLCTEDA